MTERREEILNNGEGSDLSPAIRLSLTIEAGRPAPTTARFEIIQKEGVTQGETPDGKASETLAESNAGKFHEDFIKYLSAQKYALTPVNESISPDAIFSEEVELGRRPLGQVVREFHQAITTVKTYSADRLYRKTGPSAPGTSLGGRQ